MGLLYFIAAGVILIQFYDIAVYFSPLKEPAYVKLSAWLASAFLLYLLYRIYILIQDLKQRGGNEKADRSQLPEKALLLICGLLAGIFITDLQPRTFPYASAQTLARSADSSPAETMRALRLFGDAFDKIMNFYVDEKSARDVVEAAIAGIVQSLDPYSSFLDSDAFTRMRVDSRGEFGGLGMEVGVESGLVRVVAPLDETPAAAAGILPNDIIMSVDGVSLEGMSLSDAVELMRGPIGTPTKLTIRREGSAQEISITLVRDVIRIRPVRTSLHDGILYLRLTQFNHQTRGALREAVEQALEQNGDDGVLGILLDLRNNPGGLLDQAVHVANAFLEEGRIVEIRQRGASNQIYIAEGDDISGGRPLVVLINGGSASASEIVAGALQDNGRATIVGTTSFGKGSVQTVYPLSESGALKITTALYYTPSGRVIQDKGVEPDIVIPQAIPDHLLQGREQASDEDQEKMPDLSSVYVPRDVQEDTQLEQALSILREKTLYERDL